MLIRGQGGLPVSDTLRQTAGCPEFGYYFVVLCRGRWMASLYKILRELCQPIMFRNDLIRWGAAHTV